MPMHVGTLTGIVAVRSTGDGNGGAEKDFRQGKARQIMHAWEDSPIGAIELTDAELGEVVGGVQSGASVGCNTKTCVHTRGNSTNPCGSC